MSDAQTLGVYGARAQEYAEMALDALNDDAMLAAFITAMPPNGMVLDLGAGPGHAASVMAAAGLNAYAWDAVPEMVTLAARHDGVTAQRRSFDDVAGDAIWHGVWASFSLLHAPRADMPRHLSAIRRALKPGGRFHVSVKTGSGDGRDSLGRRYSYYTEEELKTLLNAAGFAMAEHVTGKGAGLSGEVAPWVRIDACA